jgi:hypothetical protein
MLEEFLMTILEEEGPDGKCSNKMECLQKEVMDFLNYKFQDKFIGTGGTLTTSFA